MKITQIEQIPVEIPYMERVRDHLQKGWNFGNRATDDELQANRSEHERQWRESSPPTVETSIYRVHTDEGNIGIGEGAGIAQEKLQTYLGRSPFEFIMDDSVGPLQIAFYDLDGPSGWTANGADVWSLSGELSNRILVTMFPAGSDAARGKNCARRRFSGA